MLVEIITSIQLPAVICFTIGFILITVEMFYPGFGAPGIIGTILLIAGIVLTAANFTQALVMILILLAVLGAMLVIILHSAAKGPLSKTIILKEAQKKETGYIGTEDLEYFLGKEGTAITVLRPSGTADFDGVKIDVVSQGEFISEGTKLKIIKVQGRRIVVREI
jgi:membrane-bound ClpP family serine protease